MYIWNGKNAGGLKQSVALILAKEFRTVFADRPLWVSITTIFEGEEPVCFRERFLFWEEKATPVIKRELPRTQSGTHKGRDFDVTKMMNTPLPIPLPTGTRSFPVPPSSPSAQSRTPRNFTPPVLAPPPSPDGIPVPPIPTKETTAWGGLKHVEVPKFERALYVSAMIAAKTC